MMHGLNTYDYGARQMDPVICQWTTVDPLAEKYYNVSPYAYCANNPVNAVDLDGLKIVTDALNTDQLNHFNNDISSIRENSVMFDKLYSILEKSDNVIQVRFVDNLKDSNGNEINGQFVGANNVGHGGTLNLRNLDFNKEGIMEQTYTEELFHAYQFENTNYYSESFNREFEAKTFSYISSSSRCLIYAGMDSFLSTLNSLKYGNEDILISPMSIHSSAFLNLL